jgi:hypothetical protein
MPVKRRGIRQCLEISGTVAPLNMRAWHAFRWPRRSMNPAVGKGAFYMANKLKNSDQRKNQSAQSAKPAEAMQARTEPERGKGKPTKGNDPLKVSGLNEAEAAIVAQKSGTRVSIEPARGTSALFGNKSASDVLVRDEKAVMLGKSQAFRAKYAEVLRDFHEGQLRAKASNMLILDEAEAHAIAAEHAKIADEQSRA